MSEQLEILILALIEKYGKDKIVGLLTDRYSIELIRKKRNASAYYRDLKNAKTPFYDEGMPGTVEEKEKHLPPDYVLEALEDAANEMSYSNWHGSKFDIAAGEVIIRYCQEHNIKIDREITER